MAHNHHIHTEKITLQKLSMRSRKAVGMLAQRHMEDRNNPGTIDSLRTLLRDYIDTHEDTCAARWLLARLTADPLAEINCRRYICELLYGYR